MSVDANRDAEMDEQTRTGTTGSTSLLDCVFPGEFHDDRLVYPLSAAVVGVPQATPPHRRRRSQSASPCVGQVLSTRAGDNPLCLDRGEPGTARSCRPFSSRPCAITHPRDAFRQRLSSNLLNLRQLQFEIPLDFVGAAVHAIVVVWKPPQVNSNPSFPVFRTLYSAMTIQPARGPDLEEFRS